MGRRSELGLLVERTARWLSGLDRIPAVLGGHTLGAWLAREIVRRGRLAPGVHSGCAELAGAAEGRRADR